MRSSGRSFVLEDLPMSQERERSRLGAPIWPPWYQYVQCIKTLWGLGLNIKFHRVEGWRRASPGLACRQGGRRGSCDRHGRWGDPFAGGPGCFHCARHHGFPRVKKQHRWSRTNKIMKSSKHHLSATIEPSSQSSHESRINFWGESGDWASIVRGDVIRQLVEEHLFLDAQFPCSTGSRPMAYPLLCVLFRRLAILSTLDNLARESGPRQP